MKEITEEEMLRKAAAYCAEAERCRGDGEKKIARAGLEAVGAGRTPARFVFVVSLGSVPCRRGIPCGKGKENVTIL